MKYYFFVLAWRGPAFYRTLISLNCNCLEKGKLSLPEILLFEYVFTKGQGNA